MNMGIWIESRIKDSNGNTVAYRVVINNNQKEIMNAMDLIKYSEYVINASLRGNGEFIAKNGHKIKSEIYKKELQPPKYEYKQKEQGIGGDRMQQAINNAMGKEFLNKCIALRRCAIRNELDIDISQHSSNNDSRNIILLK